MPVSVEILVGVVSLSVVLVSVVCVCRGRFDLELESQGATVVQSVVELSPK